MRTFKCAALLLLLERRGGKVRALVDVVENNVELHVLDDLHRRLRLGHNARLLVAGRVVSLEGSFGVVFERLRGEEHEHVGQALRSQDEAERHGAGPARNVRQCAWH